MENGTNVVQRAVLYLVTIGEAPNLTVGEFHKHVMTSFEGVRVGSRVLSTALEVVPTHQTAIHVHWAQRDATVLFKVKIEVMTRDSINIGAFITTFDDLKRNAKKGEGT